MLVVRAQILLFFFLAFSIHCLSKTDNCSYKTKSVFFSKTLFFFPSQAQQQHFMNKTEHFYISTTEGLKELTAMMPSLSLSVSLSCVSEKNVKRPQSVYQIVGGRSVKHSLLIKFVYPLCVYCCLCRCVLLSLGLCVLWVQLYHHTVLS